jgi:hypothetical protein
MGKLSEEAREKLVSKEQEVNNGEGYDDQSKAPNQHVAHRRTGLRTARLSRGPVASGFAIGPLIFQGEGGSSDTFICRLSCKTAFMSERWTLIVPL